MKSSQFFTGILAASIACALAATPAFAQTTQEQLNQILRQLETQKQIIAKLSKEVEHLRSGQKKQAEKIASSAGSPDGSDVKISVKEGLKLKSRDGNFKFQLGGRIMTDYAHYGEDKSRLGDGTEFRRARLFLAGTFYKNLDFKSQLDFAGNSVSVKDMYIRYNFMPNSLTFGNFKQPFSLEDQTSSKYITFMEHALPNAFSPGRLIGIGYNTHGDNWSIALAGAGSSATGDADNEGDEGYSLTSRVHFAPLSEATKNVHLGAAVSYRNLRNQTLRFRERPESHVTSARFVDTGTITNVTDEVLYGLEAASVWGPFSLQGEYIGVNVARDLGLSDLDFYGWYGFASLFLTPGDHRNYNPKKGAFGRVKPKHSYADGGLGALEVAVRYSGILLTDEDILGGGEKNLTFGLNWYATSHVRFMLNYIRVNNDNNATGNAGNLLLQHASAANDDPQIIQLRAQIDF